LSRTGDHMGVVLTSWELGAADTTTTSFHAQLLCLLSYIVLVGHSCSFVQSPDALYCIVHVLLQTSKGSHV
jgi:hypothetical protein